MNPDPSTCSRAGYCIGMYPPCMAECKLNDTEQAPDHGEVFFFCEPLMWLFWLGFWAIVFGMGVGMCFLAGYMSGWIEHVAVRVWDLTMALGYVVQNINF